MKYLVDTDCVTEFFGRASGGRCFIAATAIHLDLELVTRNHRHFDRIPDLRVYEPEVPNR